MSFRCVFKVNFMYVFYIYIIYTPMFDIIVKLSNFIIKLLLIVTEEDMIVVKFFL